MDLAIRIATELAYAHVAYHKASIAENNNSCYETFRARSQAYDYLVKVQNELNNQCMMLASEPV